VAWLSGDCRSGWVILYAHQPWEAVLCQVSVVTCSLLLQKLCVTLSDFRKRNCPNCKKKKKNLHAFKIQLTPLGRIFLKASSLRKDLPSSPSNPVTVTVSHVSQDPQNEERSLVLLVVWDEVNLPEKRRVS
jgi:hypothetical protein